MRLRLERYSYRFAEQVLNSKLSVKTEIEDVLTGFDVDPDMRDRRGLNAVLRTRFLEKGWEDQPAVFGTEDKPSARMDFLKERVGVEVAFVHRSYLGMDLLKFQVASYSALDKIDVGVYVVTTTDFQKKMTAEFGKTWEGSMSFERVCMYLPHLKSAIQVPIYLLGIDL